MKASTIIIIILGIALAVILMDDMCIIKLIPSDCKKLMEASDAVSTHCDDSQRYADTSSAGGGRTIDLTTAKTMVTAFTMPTAALDYKGVTISKRAIDFMFDKFPENNTLVCYFVNGEGGTLNLVFETTAANENQVALRRDNAITGMGDGSIWLSEGMCPSICGSVGME